MATKKKKKGINTLDKYLLWAILYIMAWSIAFFLAWLKYRIEPSVLEGCILAPAVIEMIAGAYIQRGKDQNDAGNKNSTNTEVLKP